MRNDPNCCEAADHTKVVGSGSSAGPFAPWAGVRLQSALIRRPAAPSMGVRRVQSIGHAPQRPVRQRMVEPDGNVTSSNTGSPRRQPILQIIADRSGDVTAIGPDVAMAIAIPISAVEINVRHGRLA